ncbi:hypothetical protein F383_04135 [Gossypium arboreum]|uniref:Uncharacterized protein n=1 Tax=Gossypium arboreum TaxID=29729 RepID=A0A0B0P7Q6_GOSAR|nr:hypothetical protein F383_01079 [Gossypium arboreum]KHG21622.1 hypothetical protein F383_04135 [Gossypium arboreum]
MKPILQIMSLKDSVVILVNS